MRNFNQSSKRSGGGFNRRFGGGKSFGDGNRFGGRGGSRPARHKATCSECGASCELPFRPTGDRPVYCSICFKKQGNGSGGPNIFSNKRREGSRFGDKQIYEAVCVQCGKNCQVPFRPTAGKPVFCNECFKKDGDGSEGFGKIMEQVKMLNSKIDAIIKMLALNASGEKIEKLEVKEVKKEVMVQEAVKGKTKKRIAPKKVLVKNKK